MSQTNILLLKWPSSSLTRLLCHVEDSVRFTLPAVSVFQDVLRESALLKWISNQLLKSLAGVLIETSDSLLSEVEIIERVPASGRRRKYRRKLDHIRLKAWSPIIVDATDCNFQFTTCELTESLHAEQLGAPSVSGVQLVQNSVNN